MVACEPQLLASAVAWGPQLVLAVARRPQLASAVARRPQPWRRREQRGPQRWRRVGRQTAVRELWPQLVAWVLGLWVAWVAASERVLLRWATVLEPAVPQAAEQGAPPVLWAPPLPPSKLPEEQRCGPRPPSTPGK